jgi:hypothetical protein
MSLLLSAEKNNFHLALGLLFILLCSFTKLLLQLFQAAYPSGPDSSWYGLNSTIIFTDQSHPGKVSDTFTVALPIDLFSLKIKSIIPLICSGLGGMDEEIGLIDWSVVGSQRDL